MKKSAIITISKVLISLITIAILLYFANIPVLKSMLISLNIKVIFIGTILIFLMQAANTLKLYIVMSGTGINFLRILKTNLIATFFANAVPSSLGKDIIRLIYLGKSSKLRESAAAAVSLDRVSGLFTQIIILIFAVICGLGFDINLDRYIIPALVAILLSAAIIYTIFNFRIQIKSLICKMHIENIFDFSKLCNRIKQFITSPFKLIQLSIASALYQIIIIYNIVLLTHALGGHIQFYQAAIVSFAASFATLIPASVAGWGIVEGAYMLLYSIISEQKETGLAVSIGLRFLLLIPSFIGLFLFLYDKPGIRTLKEKTGKC